VFRSVSPDELASRLGANQLLVEVAVPHLQWVSGWFQHRRHVAYVVDADGIVLKSFGDPVLIATCGLSPGTDWSESVMGTNGAGTALAARSPVAVIGCDHWAEAWRDVTCLAAPIIGADGRTIGAIDVSMGVEEGDADRLLVVAHVAHTIAEQVRRREAEAANIEKDRIIATVAHELRQPLQAALAAVHVMEARRSKDSGERARSTILHQLHQMARVVEDLVDGARIVHAELELRRQVSDLRDVVEQVSEAVRPLMTAHQFSADIPEEPLLLDMDPARIQQVLMNLLSNAAKFTDAGGRIALIVTSTPSEARVVVRDTGRGIDPVMMPRIFDLFARSSGDTSGFGVGLAVARRLVELHGGRIEAYSDGPGHGSEFVVRLPIVAPPERS